MSDLLRKYKSLYSSTCSTFSTGEGVTITPASVTGLPTDTEITLTFDRVDSSGTKTPSKMERIRGTVTGGNFVISSGGRAVEGAEQVHTSPVIEMIWNADDWNDTVDWGLVEHSQSGKHTKKTVTSYTPAGAGTTTIDTSLGNVFTVTMPATTQTLAISNETVGQCFIIEINNVTSQGALTWFTTIRWADGSAPTLTGTNGKRDTFGFRVTGADTYDGYVVGQNL